MKIFAADWHLGCTVAMVVFIFLFQLKSCMALLTSKRHAALSNLVHQQKLQEFYTTLHIPTQISLVNGFSPEDEPQGRPKPKPRPVLEPPATETVFERLPIPPKSITPKILVLGATGGIGRRVIRQLMALESDMTIVAFVRDYEKACDVLYDELLIERSSKGPQLQVVVMDLVPPSFVAGYKPIDEESDDDDEDHEEYGLSASKFYKNEISDYDFRACKEDDVIDLDPYFPLKDAILNATVVISAVGTVRATIPFADYLLKPWRIFSSAGTWCKDSSHPYYVNYMLHKKVLEYCEIVQRNRNKEWRVWQNNKKRRTSKGVRDSKESNEVEKEVDKLRIVRISDHCLANRAWDVVNVFTNIFRSMVFLYQDKCEKLLSASKLVDTIILRPGDLMDDIRNETTTTMSVSIDGKLPGPVYVGRDDVASLATLAAISDLNPKMKTRKAQSVNGTMESSGIRRSRRGSKRKMCNFKPIHWNVAVGWTGKKKTGFDNAEKCMKYIIKSEARRKISERRKDAIRNADAISRIFIQPYQFLIRRVRQRMAKPYGLFAFLPMFAVVYPTIISALLRAFEQIPIVQNVLLFILSFLEPLTGFLMNCNLMENVKKSAVMKNAEGLIIY